MINQTACSSEFFSLSSPQTSKTPEQRAKDQVMGDLLNALMAEQFLTDENIELLSTEQWSLIADNAAPLYQVLADNIAKASEGILDEPPLRGEIMLARWWTGNAMEGYVLFAVTPAVVQPYRCIPSVGVYEVKLEHNGNGGRISCLSVSELMSRVIAECLSNDEQKMNGVARFLHLLDLTQTQSAWSLAGRVIPKTLMDLPSAELLQALERQAGLRDRPFHPVAKAKEGLQKEQCQQYLAEFENPITLCWMAVKRECLMYGEGSSTGATTPSDYLLSNTDQQLINEELQRLGLSQEEYLALPIHPWQMKAVIPQQLPSAIGEGVVVPMECQVGLFEATSSVRSLAPLDGSEHYLKLPLGISSLGAMRYLPAVKMINGQRGERMLRQAKERDEVLQRKLFLCDETKWWAYMPENSSLFDDPPRHLAAMVRSYPAFLIENPQTRLIPMASLGGVLAQSDYHFFDDWMCSRSMATNETSVKKLFAEVCELFLDTILRLFRIGLLPEIHGQNSVLVWRDGKLKGLLLRDHDSARLHLPWLTENGISDPNYQIRPGYSNSLYNETPHKLLHYLQSLGIQVNLYSIIDTLSTRYQIDERLLWRVLHGCLEDMLENIDFSVSVRQQIHEQLFTQQQWPLKCLIRPLLHQSGVPGAMPASWSTIRNPLLYLD